MPSVQFFGKVVRARIMLDAIGAQEALEAAAAAVRSCPSPSRAKMLESVRLAAARRRNAAEVKLSQDEHAAWARWRLATPAARAAGRAQLIGEETLAPPAS